MGGKLNAMPPSGVGWPRPNQATCSISRSSEAINCSRWRLRWSRRGSTTDLPMPTPFIPGRTLLVLALVVGLVPRLPGAQDAALSPSLRRDHYRSGEATLSAFAPVSEATRNSIVKLNVNGTTVALATVVDTNGLALTKASELKKGKLTCWLANEKEVDAELISTDDEED